MLAYQAQVAEELEQALEDGDRMERLTALLGRRESAYRAAAERVSQARHVLAERFTARMLEQLGQLGMGSARFAVDFARAEPAARAVPAESASAVEGMEGDDTEGAGDSGTGHTAAEAGAEAAPETVFHEDGVDQVSFLIAPNPGEPLRPLARIASGGELSRLMLAIKSIAAVDSGVPVVIFDEIDTGISGRMAQVVAEKMADIARGCQVVCVTHLPQIAAMADVPYRVRKDTDGVRTWTQLERLDEAGHVLEIARMLGGADPESESSRTHAAALLADARAWKRRVLEPSAQR
jgi:DNA repair protein RecN (Recombination protein N)